MALNGTKNCKSVDAKLHSGDSLPKLRHDQEEKLEESFVRVKNPSSSDVLLLAMECGMNEESVRIWWAHRLALWRKQQGLPANGRSVMD